MLLLALFACKVPADAMPPTPGGAANARGEGPKGPPPGQGGAPYERGQGGQPGAQGGQGGQGRDQAEKSGDPSSHPNAAAMSVSFVPPTGRLSASRFGPGNFRILSATSKDGVHFTPTNQIVTDQGNVPDLVTDTKGTLYLYYTTAKFVGFQDVLALARSTDGGKTWVHHTVTVSGARPPVVDPDVVLLPDGSFRLYYTGGQDKKPAISYAEGKDGLSFVSKGEVYAPPEGAIDSNVFRVADTWQMYAFDAKGTPMHHATSKDGTRFTRTSQAGQVHRSVFASNGVAAPGGVRMFAFDRREGITAWTSSDGASWKKDANFSFARSTTGLEGDEVKDAAATQLRDGSWFAVYTTPIP